MIYEWRVYEVALGKMDALNDRFTNVSLRLFMKHGIKVVGFWRAIVGTSNILYYMLAFNSLAHREKVWNEFLCDPEWVEAKRRSEKDGPLVERIQNMILEPTSYSPLQ